MSQQIATGMKLVTQADSIVTIGNINERAGAAWVTVAQKGKPVSREELWDMANMHAGIKSGAFRVVLDQTAVMA